MSRWAGHLISKTPVIPSGPAPTAAAPGVWTLPEVAYWIKQGRWPSASADPYWSYVSFLLGTTATNGAQNNTFLDSSANNYTITRAGNTTQGSATPFGTLWSNYFDGTSDSLTYTGGSSLNFGTGDFTVELWAFLANTGTYSPFIRPDDSGAFPEFGYDFSTGQLKFDARNGAIANITTTMPTNQWVHLAAARSGTNLRLFVNGTQVGTTTTNSTNFGSTTGTIRIGGSNFSASHTVNGYLSNLRVVVGTALYTAAFTPTGAPLTAISGTSLLTCQNNRFLDSSSNAFAITPSGNVSATPFSPFVLAPPGYDNATNGGSGYFDGSGDYLTVPASSNWVFSGDYTLEAWVYPSASGVDMQIFGTGGSGSNDQFGVTSGVGTGRVYWAYSAVGNYLTTTATIPAGAWSHIAVTRSSNTLRAFVNGAQVFSGTMSTTVGQNATNYIGRRSDGFNSFTGNMAGARIVTGTALYTAAFTPSATPPTAVTNTSLLLNFANAGVFDASMNNDIETVGNAQVSTGQAKFGTTSAYFDGSGDVLLSPAGLPFNFGTGDFTVEFWMYKTSSTAYQRIVAYGGFTAAGNFQIEATDDTTLTVHINGGYLTTTVPSLLNSWVYVTVTRQSGSVRVFTNGTLRSTNTQNGSVSQTNPFSVGAVYDASSPFTGYIDDLRVTKGYARYTASFTAPTAALPVY